MRSNNIAEYQGLIMLLEHLDMQDTKRGQKGKYLVCGDSELVIKQMRGEYRVSKPHLVPLNTRAKQLASGLDVEFKAIRREYNEAGFLLE